MRVLICGDILPQPINQEEFAKGDVSLLLDEGLISLFRSADLIIGNLEGPLTDTEKKIMKSGVCLKAPVNTVEGIARIGFKCISLANNHILDYGEIGYHSTISALHGAKINTIGAGVNKFDARDYYIYNDDLASVGVYSCAEHEFTIATENRAGANGFNALYTLDDISNIKAKCKYLIVLYHGMKEYYQYPVPYVQERCRRMIEYGADIVLCQHTHCIGSRETWKNGEILYGQGNFMFHFGDNKLSEEGLITCVDFTNSGTNISYIPIVKKGIGVSLPDDEEKRRIRNFG